MTKSNFDHELGRLIEQIDTRSSAWAEIALDLAAVRTKVRRLKTDSPTPEQTK